MTYPANNVSPDLDYWANRGSVSRARSEKLIQSWRLSKREREPDAQEVVSDDDFNPTTEAGGIGSKAETFDDDSAADGTILPRKTPTGKDKLLEQLLGSRAANEKRKDLATKKKMSTSTSKHTVSKALAQRPKQAHNENVESEDDEEGGRASAFQSRRPQKNGQRTGLKSEPLEDADEESPDGVATTTGLKATKVMDLDSASASEMDNLPPKTKKGSYLDEVLAQGSRKRKKKSHQK